MEFTKVIIDGETLDALNAEAKNWRRKAEQLAADNVTLSKANVDLTKELTKKRSELIELRLWKNEADPLIWKMIKENNELRAQIKKQEEVEANLWRKIRLLETPDYDTGDFN